MPNTVPCMGVTLTTVKAAMKVVRLGVTAKIEVHR